MRVCDPRPVAGVGRTLVVACLVVSCLVVSEPAAAQGAAPAGELPTVYMDYSLLFDATCSELSGEPIEREWAVEVLQRLDEFRAAWLEASPDLLGATVDVVGRPFPFREIRAALVVCPIRSLSFPLTISMWLYLAAARGDDAAPPSAFVETLYHELLHSYTYELLPPEPTPLILKYREEPRIVRAHLHVYAVMAAAYEALGRTDEFEAILEYDAGLAPTAARVWQTSRARARRRSCERSARRAAPRDRRGLVD